MSWLFGATQNKSSSKSASLKTILVLDVENASVGAGLVHIAPGKTPRLFAEKRIPLSIQNTLDSTRLVHEIEKAVHELLVHARGSDVMTGGQSTPSHTAIFLAAPWSTPSWSRGKAVWNFEPYIQKNLWRLAQDAPTTFHATGSALVHTIDTAFEHDDAFLLCSITGEVAEILYVLHNQIIARATVPFGTHTIARTLASHAGVPLHAAHSALRLVDTSPSHPHPGPSWIHEPLSSAATHFAENFADAAKALYASSGLRGEHAAHSVLVVAPEPLGELFASMLGNSTKVSELFPEGGTVRALRPHHLVPHLWAEKSAPDLHLMAEALFAHKNI